MSNISQNMMNESQSLSYSNSSSSSRQQQHGINYERLTDSLQYLDRIRKVNQSIYNAGKRNANKDNASSQGVKKDSLSQNNNLSALQRLVNLNQQITYIDNDKLYGIVSVQKYTTLKSTLSQLHQQLYQTNQSQQTLKQQNVALKKQVKLLLEKQSQLVNTINLLQGSLNNQRQLRQSEQQKVLQLTDTISVLTNERANDSKLYLALQNDFQTYKYSQQPLKKPSSYMMISQIQTDHVPVQITIPPFEFESKLEEIMKQLQSKQSNDMLSSTESIKKIVEQSLQTFVQQLQSQYELIQKQTVDLTELTESNEKMLEQNNKLRQQLQKISIEESKLEIFKSCMTEFLQTTSESVTNTIESDRVRGKVGALGQWSAERQQQHQQQQQQANVINPQQQEQQQQQQQNLQKQQKQHQLILQQNTHLQQNIEHYKKENLKLIKTIGEYQYKWRNVQKVLEQNKKQAIPDDGTVGHLVKMSKLVKQSIKNLLHQL